MQPGNDRNIAEATEVEGVPGHALPASHIVENNTQHGHICRRKGLKRQQGVIEAAESVTGHDQCGQLPPAYEVEGRGILIVGCEQPARAFDDEGSVRVAQFGHLRVESGDVDGKAGGLGSKQRGKRRIEMITYGHALAGPLANASAVGVLLVFAAFGRFEIVPRKPGRLGRSRDGRRYPGLTDFGVGTGNEESLVLENILSVRLLHISDIHFGPPHRAEMDTVVRKLVEDEQPDALVVSGDLTQRARPEQFTEARNWLASLRVPQVVIPGNHDVPLWAVHERLGDPFGRYRTHLSDELEPTLRLDGVWIYGLNTAKGFTLKNGVFRASSLQAMKAFFADAPRGTLRVATAHHHLLPAPGQVYDPVASRARAAAYALNEAGVDVLLSGHLHHSFVVQVRDHYPRLRHRTLVVHSGTTMSTRGRHAEHGMNSLNVIEADGARLHIEHRHYSEEQKRFVGVAGYQYPLGDAPES